MLQYIVGTRAFYSDYNWCSSCSLWWRWWLFDYWRSFPFSDAAETVLWMKFWTIGDVTTSRRTPGLHSDRESRRRRKRSWIFAVQVIKRRQRDLVILGAYYSTTARHESTASQARPLAFNTVSPGHVHLSATSIYAPSAWFRMVVFGISRWPWLLPLWSFTVLRIGVGYGGEYVAINEQHENLRAVKQRSILDSQDGTCVFYREHRKPVHCLAGYHCQWQLFVINFFQIPFSFSCWLSRKGVVFLFEKQKEKNPHHEFTQLYMTYNCTWRRRRRRMSAPWEGNASRNAHMQNAKRNWRSWSKLSFMETMLRLLCYPALPGGSHPPKINVTLLFRTKGWT